MKSNRQNIKILTYVTKDLLLAQLNKLHKRVLNKIKTNLGVSLLTSQLYNPVLLLIWSNKCFGERINKLASSVKDRLGFTKYFTAPLTLKNCKTFSPDIFSLVRVNPKGKSFMSEKKTNKKTMILNKCQTLFKIRNIKKISKLTFFTLFY